MTLYQFNRLDLNDKADRCWNNGKYICSRVTESRKSLFFAVDDFYVEIATGIVEDAITEVVPFYAGTRYDRMVESMKLPDLS